MDDLKEFPWATAALIFLTLVAALVGGAVVIWGDPGALSFKEYLDDLEKFAVAVGVLGIGRGVRSAAKEYSVRRHR
jgi:hypothetical protein